MGGGSRGEVSPLFEAYICATRKWVLARDSFQLHEQHAWTRPSLSRCAQASQNIWSQKESDDRTAKGGLGHNWKLRGHAMLRGAAFFGILQGVVGFTCYPEYSFSWCDNTTEASCIHNYAFSACDSGGRQNYSRKLTAYYTQNQRPPLTEAVFLTRLPRPYQLEFVQGGCAVLHLEMFTALMTLTNCKIGGAKLAREKSAVNFQNFRAVLQPSGSY
eukprot:s3192_g8.t1